MTARRKAEPKVGIFFVVDGKHPFVDGTPVNQASGYGDFLIHEADHLTYWDQLLEARAVPSYEYDEVPRGRVCYDTNTQTYHILLDMCILKNGNIVEDITRVMNLRPQPATEIGLDSHYRCPGCMHQPTE